MFDSLRDILWRCWTGEFSLGRIFWTGVIAIVSVVGFLGFAAPRLSAFLPDAYASFATLFAGLCLCTLPFLIPLWIVLLWRAGWGTGRRGKALPVLAIAAACLLSVPVVMVGKALTPIMGDAFSQTMDDPQKGPRGVRVGNRDHSVLVYGYISLSVADDLAAVLDSDPDIRIVEFDSPGGRNMPAERMADLIQSRGLDTRVSARCASACTTIFLSGRQRFMRAGATFGFHASTAGDGSIAERGTEKVRQRAIAAGVARPFVARAYQGKQMWYPSSVELKEAGVVTAILPN